MQTEPSMFSPERKPNRLPSYDHSSCGAYFFTVCTKGHHSIFWKSNVGEAISLPGQATNLLNQYGHTVNAAITSIPKYYPNITVDKYTIMPNHLHMILLISAPESQVDSPSISTVIGQMKRWVPKQIGVPIWQRSFHDHVIRGEKDYRMIWKYIGENPYRWELDCFYTK